MADEIIGGLVRVALEVAAITAVNAAIDSNKSSRRSHRNVHAQYGNINSRNCYTNRYCRYCHSCGDCYRDRNGVFYCTDRARCLERGSSKNHKSPRSRKSPKAKRQLQKSPKALEVDKILKCGYLNKRGWWNTAYKRRYFKLWKNGKMAYFMRAADSMECGHFQLVSGDSVEMTSGSTFKIVTATRTWDLECKSEHQCAEWVESICSVIGGTVKNYSRPKQDLEPGMNGYYNNKDYQQEAVEAQQESIYGPGYNENVPSAPYIDDAVAPSAMSAMSVLEPSAPEMDSCEGTVTGKITEQ